MSTQTREKDREREREETVSKQVTKRERRTKHGGKDTRLIYLHRFIANEQIISAGGVTSAVNHRLIGLHRESITLFPIPLFLSHKPSDSPTIRSELSSCPRAGTFRPGIYFPPPKKLWRARRLIWTKRGRKKKSGWKKACI